MTHIDNDLADRRGRFNAVLNSLAEPMQHGGWSIQGDAWYDTDSNIVVVTGDKGVRTYHVELFASADAAARMIDGLDTDFYEVDMIVDLRTGMRLQTVTALTEYTEAGPIEPEPLPEQRFHHHFEVIVTTYTDGKEPTTQISDVERDVVITTEKGLEYTRDDFPERDDLAMETLARALAVAEAVKAQRDRWLEDGTLDPNGLLPGSGADHAESFYLVLDAAGLTHECRGCQSLAPARHSPLCYYTEALNADD